MKPVRAEAAAPAMASPTLMGSTAPAGVRSGSSTNARAARSAPRRSFIARPAPPPGGRFRPSAPLPPPPWRVRGEAGPAAMLGRERARPALRGRRHVGGGGTRRGRERSAVIKYYMLWLCRRVLEWRVQRIIMVRRDF